MELVIALVGVAILVAALVLDLDELELGDGWLSGAVLGSALAGFGFAAMIVPDTWSGIGTTAVAGGAAVGAAFVTRSIFRGLARAVEHEPPRTEDLLGSVASVVSEIPPGAPGQVAATLHGGPVRLSAVCDGAVPRGTQVLIVGVLSPTQVQVVATEPGALPPA